jgi:hypothetical protein
VEYILDGEVQLSQAILRHHEEAKINKCYGAGAARSTLFYYGAGAARSTLFYYGAGAARSTLFYYGAGAARSTLFYYGAGAARSTLFCYGAGACSYTMQDYSRDVKLAVTRWLQMDKQEKSCYFICFVGSRK